MTAGTDPMMRWLPTPRTVQVDPKAVLVLPRQWPRPCERPLGVLAGAIDLRMDEQWIEAVLYRWVRVQMGFWIGEIGVTYTSRNGAASVHLHQWVHEQAVRLLPDEVATQEANSDGRLRSSPSSDRFRGR